MDNKQRPRPYNSLLIPILILMLFIFVFSPMVRGSFSAGQESYTLEKFQEDLKNGNVESVTITPNRDNDTGYAVVTLKDNTRNTLYATQIAVIEQTAREAGIVPVVRDIPSDNLFMVSVLPTILIVVVCLFFFYMHNFGDDFARAYGIQFTDKDNKLKYAFQTSWGLSTRIIGALIMVHGDNSGLVLPPKIAPTQVMIIPIQQRKAGVLEKAAEIKEMLKDFRVKVDETDKSPGFKFAEQEMRGIPLRVEIGPRDIAEGKCVVVRRDTREKIACDIASLPEKIGELLPQIQSDMYERAKKHLEEHTFEAPDKETFEALFEETKGFVKAMWCGSRECEEKIKEDYSVTSRCIPYKQQQLSDVCVCCGKPATKMVYWGRAY